MRVVDQATRNDVRSAQLDKLEADNYNEDQVSHSLSQHNILSTVSYEAKHEATSMLFGRMRCCAELMLCHADMLLPQGAEGDDEFVDDDDEEDERPARKRQRAKGSSGRGSKGGGLSW
jgi:hypothetical protein